MGKGNVFRLRLTCSCSTAQHMSDWLNCFIKLLPCFPENKTGSYCNFLSKNNTRAYFREISFIFIYQKQNSKVENFEIFKYTKYEKRYPFANK